MGELKRWRAGQDGGGRGLAAILRTGDGGLVRTLMASGGDWMAAEGVASAAILQTAR